MPEKFIIFARARTGSYHLVSLIDSCSDVVCHGELFKPHRVELRKSFRAKVGIRSPAIRDAAPSKFIQKVRKLTPDAHFGFKVFPSHAKRVPTLNKLLISKEWKIIILCRDPIETYASVLRARKTRIWTVRNNRSVPDEILLDQRVTFSQDTLLEFARSYNGFLRRINVIRSRRDDKCFVIDYKQLDQLRVRQELLCFIESCSSADQMNSVHVKQFSRPVQDGFENWDDLSRYLGDKQVFLPNPVPSVG